MDIAAWLRSLGLERYASAFRDNEIDAAVLPKLTAEDLKDLGVSLVGHRRKLLDAIAALPQASAPAPEAAEPAPPGRPGHLTDRSGPATPEAERRQLTIMFVDLVGSTALSSRLDPEDLREVMRTYQEACAGVITRFEGHIARYMGDGVLTYFGYPRAHEDEAERAVRAGLAVVDAVGRLTAPDATRLAARIGIATGRVVVGDLIGAGAAQEQAVVGETPNLAARLQALAEPDTVVIDPTTHRLVGELFEVADRGAQPLKGLAEPVRAWRILGDSRAESRFEAFHPKGLTPLVGREQEMALLLDRWERATEGEGQVVLLSGEPGIGKSRLIQALRERLSAAPHTRLRYYGSPYHQNSALHPVITQLERAAALARNDPPSRRLDKLETLLTQSADNLAEAVPLLAALLTIPAEGRYPPLDLSPQRQKDKTLELLVEQLSGLGGRHPVLMIWEDAQWLDPTSLEFLGRVVDRAQSTRVLVVITFRPEFTPPWLGYPHVTLLTLNRLSRRSGAAMVDRLAAGKALPPNMLDHILAQTDGVPLFIEELTKAALESGLLLDRGGHYELTGLPSPLAIPATLHGSLMARLDRLEPVREVAQIGAVIGREFSHEMLVAVAPLPPAQVEQALARLIDAGLVFRHGTPPQARYRFKHALVQETAYRTLLRSRRRHLHARVADILERRFPETAETQPELLAHHCEQAGLVHQAVEYQRKAGEQAFARSATAEAISQFRKGLSLLEVLPDDGERRRQELDLQVALGSGLRATKGSAAPETGRTHARALALCRQVGETPQIFQVLHGQFVFHHVRGEFRPALGIAEELLSRAEHQPDTGPRVVGHRAMGVGLFALGDFPAARRHLEQALALYEPERHRSLAHLYTFDPRIGALGQLCWILFALGDPDQALTVSRQAVEEAGAMSHFSSMALAGFYRCGVHQFLRNDQDVRHQAQELIDLADERGFAFWLASGRIMGGWAQAQGGQLAAGIAQMRRGLADYLSTRARYYTPYFRALLAEAYGQADHTSARPLLLLNVALRQAERTGESWFQAELYRRKGEVLLVGPDRNPTAAEACFRDALALARRQHARMWELRAAVSFARLRRDQHHRAEAYDLLASVTTGFGTDVTTTDLRDANALLGELKQRFTSGQCTEADRPT